MGTTATGVPRGRESTEVVVIGAGPAGLAASACLRRPGIDFIIFEKRTPSARPGAGTTTGCICTPSNAIHPCRSCLSPRNIHATCRVH
ncbi:MAG: FAD-dependent monooxygenase [Pseudolabrys sp.]